ncbi:hypothetical protein B0T11DRAFT_270370 [Plectosphaerella cucumerina]|uniref:Secreted protein n=1 Tax=Plectosphaerella cucumerina TaxID=40658 RepID=A0A8K0TV08_9PEZI|nr:hypothetical protein B0T11DRAFT_270370 [Plectosphaerella cucumerina]
MRCLCLVLQVVRSGLLTEVQGGQICVDLFQGQLPGLRAVYRLAGLGTHGGYCRQHVTQPYPATRTPLRSPTST